METGKVIFLNGTSSAGKSTLAKEIQKISKERWFHVQLDTFLHMIHDKFYMDQKTVLETVNTGASIMHEFILNLCENGENVILDTVIENRRESWLKECARLLHGVDVLLVRVSCPLHELERRELGRGDRPKGLAEKQLANMSIIKNYDVEVNTFASTIEECAKTIESIIKEDVGHKEFIKIYEKYKVA